MSNLLSVLSKEEYVSLSLRALYSGYGYEKFRMSKFEEYDLYVKNKDFLVSESVITFTDTNGKLMALKPDVTLSIVKNSKFNGEIMKVYYDEKVYRVSKNTKSFKEIAQAGLECMGEISKDTISEVLYLASKSLDLISNSNVLCISSLSIISAVLDYAKITGELKEITVKLLGEKNLFAVKELLTKEGVSDKNVSLICDLVTTYGKIYEVAPMLEKFNKTSELESLINEFLSVIDSVIKLGANKENVIIDFSVVNDMNYYNGIAFKGYVEGVPTGILSGGQYDKLMKKMQKNYGAIGFAVYLDELSRV